MPRPRLPSPVLGETPVMTRDEASLAFRTTYFDGKYCVQGHLDWRYVSTGQCRSCLKPPPPVTRYIGDSVYPYKFMMMFRLKMIARPENEDQRKNLELMLERAARHWAYTWGLAKPESDELR